MLEIKNLTKADSDKIPLGVERLEYVSSHGEYKDWALLWSGQSSDWIVCIHGHGASGQQLYCREDVRKAWLMRFRNSGCGIITPNLRNNAWMSPEAGDDLHNLLDFLRRQYSAQNFLLFSGSMGGTSNVIYSSLYPQDVTAAVALGAATDLTTYYQWCRTQRHPVITEIADHIQQAYKGNPDQQPKKYLEHSALANADRFAVPLFLAHGQADQTIPVEQSRTLAEKLKAREDFTYYEVPQGNHDSPLFIDEPFEWLAGSFGF